MADVGFGSATVLAGAGAESIRGLVGAAVTAGQCVYYSDDTDRYELSDANSSSQGAQVHGLTLHAAAAGQPVTIQTEGDVLCAGVTGVTAGGVYLVSTTPGGMAPITDAVVNTYRNIVAVGVDTSTLRLCLCNTDILRGPQGHNILMKRVISPISVADNTPQVGQIIDRQGFEAVTFHIGIGSVADADATFTVLVEDGNDPALADAAAVIDAQLLSQTVGVAPETAASFAFNSDSQVRKIGYNGVKRYVRLTITPANNLAAALFDVLCELAAGPYSPLIQTAA